MNNNTQFHITDFFEAERPRERMARLGPKSLSNAELPAILIRVGAQGGERGTRHPAKVLWRVRKAVQVRWKVGL